MTAELAHVSNNFAVARTARDVAKAVALRLADEGNLASAIAASRCQTTFPEYVQWRDHTVAAGYGGTALLFAAADACWPSEGWDRIGHHHLATACAALQAKPHANVSLYGGLAGVGFAAITLAAGRARYGRLVSSIDGALLPRVVRSVQRLEGLAGCGVGDFDLISGLTGVGVYLLARRLNPEAASVLRLLVGCLTRLVGDQGEPRRWHTPAHLLGEAMSEAYRYGNHNCGLAHGLPGPLALLSIALREGVSTDGTAAAVDTAARWLAEHRIEQAWGPDWPNAVGLPVPEGAHQARATPQKATPSRAAWCYGAPGVARALWLAGEALKNDYYRDLAVQTMRAVLARPRDQRGLTSPTFCHGTAGLLQITVRFARDTGLPEFATCVEGLVAESVDAYEPDSLLGYLDIEPSGVRVDQPGLLQGAPGVALALLAASTPVNPASDRLFLLS